MNGRNIYFSGPDGTRKTTIACCTAKWLNQEFGLPARVVHFPTERSLSSSILRLDMDKPPKIELGAGARDILFVADRLETMATELAPERIKNPQLWFIFDRGPVDGAVYAEATDKLRVKPVGITADWIEKCDAKFTEKFPVDLGFFLTATVELSQQMMAERGKMDRLDRNLALQHNIREIFERHLRGKKEWVRIEVDKHPDELLELQADRVFARVKQHLRREIPERDIEGRLLSAERFR